MSNFSNIRVLIAGRTVHTVTPDTAVRKAAMVMADSHIGGLPVVADGKLVGIFTERDMVRRVIAKGYEVETTTIHTVMTPEPDTIAPEQPLYRALDTMHQRGYRHLPVVETDRVIGMVSMRDMPLNYRILRSRWMQEKTDVIRSIGTLIGDRTVHTVTPETTVWQAAILMADNRITTIFYYGYGMAIGAVHLLSPHTKK